MHAVYSISQSSNSVFKKGMRCAEQELLGDPCWLLRDHHFPKCVSFLGYYIEIPTSALPAIIRIKYNQSDDTTSQNVHGSEHLRVYHLLNGPSWPREAQGLHCAMGWKTDGQFFFKKMIFKLGGGNSQNYTFNDIF